MATSSATSLDAVLTDGLAHLREQLSEFTFDELAELPRAELLTKLKAIGVERLADRQKLATAIAKAARKPASAEETKAPTRDLESIPPQSFSIYCHNTTLADGTQLDNDNPAPEFMIATLEERTGIPRPENADKISVHQLNLHFMCGGGGGGGSVKK